MNQAQEESCRLLPNASGMQCKSMRALVALRVTAPSGRNASTSTRGQGRGPQRSGLADNRFDGYALAEALGSSISRLTGTETEAMSVTAEVPEHELLRFIRAGSATATVLILDRAVLFRWPDVDWHTPLLRARNRLSEDGVKLYLALSTEQVPVSIPSPLRGIRHRYLTHRVASFCEAEGIGFLGSTDYAPLRDTAQVSKLSLEERTAAGIAAALTTPRNYCCHAFRIGAMRDNLGAVAK
jgi:hypothetical protein